MKHFIMIAIALLYFLPVPARAQSASEQINAIQKMENDTLTRLYREKPETKNDIKQAAGYAVFSSGELAVLGVSAGYGHGIAHSNPDAKDTYMKMAKAGVGVGLGVKDYDVVFVFHDPKVLRTFTTTGLDLSGTADMAAKMGPKGGAASAGADVLAGVKVYQMTESGVMAQAMIQGTKYWRDDELNNAKLSEEP